MKLSTRNIHAGLRESDPSFGSVVPPIYLTATYIFPNAKTGADRFAGKKPGMIYSRFTNPTVYSLETRLASLEEAEMAIATSSGMAAIQTTLFHFLKAGDTVVSHNVVYGGTYELLTKILPRFNIKVKLVDFSNAKKIEEAIDNKTKLLYFETPTNPLLEVIDISSVVTIARRHKIISVIDSTFSPPPVTYSHKMGVDIVIHALTKYIGGHSDLIGGAIIGSKKLLTPIYKRNFIFFGPTMSPFTAYLALRGLTTLDIRINRLSENALRIATYLSSNPKVARVNYPGISSHPNHKLAQKQMNSLYGGTLSFEVKGGYKAGEKLVNAVKLISLAVSLGAVESLIEHPASMTHSELLPRERKEAQISDGLIRFSVGLEDPQDIIDDLEQALFSL